MESVLGGAGVGCFLDLGLDAARTSRLGECVRDGGEEIGESWLYGGGVLPRKGLRPLNGAPCVARGRGGLSNEALLLLRGRAIVSLMGSGVSERASMEGISTSCGDEGVSFSTSDSSLSDPVVGTAS